MKKHIVIFSGSTQNEYGMPEPFYFYAVFISPYKQSKGYFAVSVFSVSRGTPEETQGTRLLEVESEEEALQVTLRQLKEHPLHKGLSVQESALPAIEL